MDIRQIQRKTAVNPMPYHSANNRRENETAYGRLPLYVPSTGIEPVLPAPEAGTLSAELRGHADFAFVIIPIDTVSVNALHMQESLDSRAASVRGRQFVAYNG